ncbi:MAG TPA: glycosyltransferase [Mycobacteriales bacterium]|nr:glycosyltransferase [Mycobacteriales bacterium]
MERFPVLSQTFVSNEVAELRRQGVDVVVAALRPGDAAPIGGVPVLPARAAHDGRLRLLRDHARYLLGRPDRYLRFLLTVRALPAERREIAWRRLPRLARQLDRAGVDRLHAHFAWGGAALAAALSALTGWPWAMTMHARDIFTDRRNLALKLSRADLLISVCDYNLRYLRDELHCTRPVAKVICGVELPPPSGLTPTTDVVCVARLVEKKGVDVLLRAVAKLLAERPALTVRIVGDGPLAGELHRLRDELGLAGHVVFDGALPHAATLDVIAAARVLCLPARVARDGDIDSMPLVVKEAMAREVTVVAADAGGVGEMVEGGAGVLVPPDDDDALATALRELLADDDRRAQLAAAGRARVAERFTLSGEVGRLRTLLASLG